jgi:hypothetical protein
MYGLKDLRELLVWDHEEQYRGCSRTTEVKKPTVISRAEGPCSLFCRFDVCITSSFSVKDALVLHNGLYA